jgi:hypothetical protein
MLVPAAGATVAWTLRDDRTDAVLQSGTVAAESAGLVAINGITIPKDPQRVRLELRIGAAARPGDLDGDGLLDGDDLALMAASPADLDGDGAAGPADVEMLERYVLRHACPGDLDGSGTVNGADLGQLLASWGPCGQGCSADLDGNGFVGGADLGTLLADWGACP